MPCRTINVRICLDDAPTASRIPISRVLRATA